MEPIRILVADDHAIVRSGLRVLLESMPDIEVVGEAGTGEETIHQVASLRPAILLLDIALPGMNGLEGAGPWWRWGTPASRSPTSCTSASTRSKRTGRTSWRSLACGGGLSSFATPSPTAFSAALRTRVPPALMVFP